MPHLFNRLCRIAGIYWHSVWARLSAIWWGVHLEKGCVFLGSPQFRRYPGSRILIGSNCKFNSSPTSNLIGVNRPCIFSTLKEGAEIIISKGCGFSGTIIACAERIDIGENVRCGANTLINDTDWHFDDDRTGLDAPIIIGDNVWLAVNVTILKGVKIGNNTIIGAGSVVTKSLPSDVIAAGIPARVIRNTGKNFNVEIN